MKQKETIGTLLGQDGLVCLECFHYYEDEATREGETLDTTPAYAVGYPDGYTCAMCGDEWYPEGHKGEQQ
jgi:hypothetical protein